MGAPVMEVQLALPRSLACLTLPAATKVPEPVRRYLVFANAYDRAAITAARILFRGWLKSEPDGKSRFMHSVLELTSTPWTRSWTGNPKSFGVRMRARDTYGEGQGRMRVELLSAFAIRNVSSPELTASELVTLLAELPFMPTSLVPSDRLSWSAIDDGSAHATLRDGNLEVSGIFRIDERGRIWRFESNDRYRVIDRQYVRVPWQVTYREYMDFGGVQVPMWVQEAWVINGERSNYADFSVTGLSFSPVANNA